MRVKLDPILGKLRENDETTSLSASAITNTPAGTIAAVTVQAALNELDTEKAAVTALQTLADISGAVTLTLIAGNTHATSVANNVTSWAFVLPNDGDIARVRIANATGKSIASTGLVGYIEGDLTKSGLSATTLASALWDLYVVRGGASYFVWGAKRT